MESQDTKICIVGLGNPGKKYLHTRHNIGEETLQYFLQTLLNDRPSFQHNNFLESLLSIHKIDRARFIYSNIIAVIPQTFMNLSGRAVQKCVAYYKLDFASEVIIVSDDMDFPPKTIKLLPQGGAGGHKGLASIIESFGGNKTFHRLRVGIGRPEPHMTPSKYVLEKLKEDALDVHLQTIDIASQALVTCLKHGLSQAMQIINSKPKDV